jgi:hypothetical protein
LEDVVAILASRRTKLWTHLVHCTACLIDGESFKTRYRAVRTTVLIFCIGFDVGCVGHWHTRSRSSSARDESITSGESNTNSKFASIVVPYVPSESPEATSDRIDAALTRAHEEKKGIRFFSGGHYQIARPIRVTSQNYVPFINGRKAYITAAKEMGPMISVETSDMPIRIFDVDLRGATHPWQLDAQNCQMRGDSLAQTGISVSNSSSVLMADVTVKNTSKAAISMTWNRSVDDYTPSPVWSVVRANLRHNQAGILAKVESEELNHGHSKQVGYLNVVDSAILFSRDNAVDAQNLQWFRFVGGSVEGTERSFLKVQDTKAAKISGYFENYGGWLRQSSGSWCPRSKAAALTFQGTDSISFRGRLAAEIDRGAGPPLSIQGSTCALILARGKVLKDDSCKFSDSYPPDKLYSEHLNHIHSLFENGDDVVEIYPTDSYAEVLRKFELAGTNQQGIVLSRDGQYNWPPTQINSASATPAYIEGRNATIRLRSDPTLPRISDMSFLRFFHPGNFVGRDHFSIRNLNIDLAEEEIGGIEIVGGQNYMMHHLNISASRSFAIRLSGATGRGLYYASLSDIKATNVDSAIIINSHQEDKTANAIGLSNLNLQTRFAGVSLSWNSSTVFHDGVRGHETSKIACAVATYAALTLNSVSDLVMEYTDFDFSKCTNQLSWNGWNFGNYMDHVQFNAASAAFSLPTN